MESKDLIKTGYDPDGCSKRRISSILKIPRTSIKGVGVEQDDQEETRPLEKRRNSRRVSFASTNNIHLFSKDVKAESPVLGSVQNLNIGASDGQNKRILHCDAVDKQDVTGWDPLPHTSVHGSHLRGSFFQDSAFQDNYMDRTVLHGEETGYMDMTHSHTVCIDKDDLENPEITVNMSANESKIFSFKTQTVVPVKANGELEQDAAHLEFCDFLASVSKPTANRVGSCMEATNILELNKENILPCLTKQLHCPVSSKPQGLQSRCLEVQAEQSMDLTKSHTIVIDGQKIPQHTSYSAGQHATKTGLNTWFFSNDSEDMELTQGQAAIINVKTMGNEEHNMLLIGRCKSTLVPDKMKGEALILTASSEKKHEATTYCDDMEITQSQTAVLETEFKNYPFQVSSFVPGPSPTNIADELAITQIPTKLETLRQLVTDTQVSRRRSHSTDSHNDQSELMEMTGQPSGFLFSHYFEDMELTGCNTVGINSKSILQTKETVLEKSFLPQLSKTVKSQIELSPVDTVENMEMTQCQTVVLETKCCGQNNISAASAMKSLGPQIFRNDVSSTEDVTSKFTGHEVLRNKNCPPQAQVFKQQGCLKGMQLLEGENSDKLTSFADMDLTGCKTVTIDTDTCVQTMSEAARGKFRMVPTLERAINKHPIQSMNVEAKNRAYNNESLSYFADMELNKGHTVVIDSVNVETENPLTLNHKAVMSYYADQDLTKGQTIVIDATNHVGEIKENPSFDATKHVKNLIKDFDTELTTAILEPFEHSSVFFNQQKRTENSESSLAIADYSSHKEMDNDLVLHRTVRSVSNLNKCFPIDMNVDLKKKQLTSRKRSLTDLQEKLQSSAQHIDEPNTIVAESVTAPLASFAVLSPNNTTKKKCIVQATGETPSFKNKLMLPNKEGTTPFKLLSSRLSLGSIMPKLSAQVKFATTNKVELMCPNDPQRLQLGDLQTLAQYNSYETQLDNEELPEEDLSSTASYLSIKPEQQMSTKLASTGNGFELQMSAPALTLNKLDEMPSKSLNATQNVNGETLVTEDTNSHSSSASMKCDGIAESTLGNSHLDCHFEKTVDQELEFEKKLEDGSITVNEFLKHFGAEFVIHKSRASSVPDDFKASRTHTVEDLLKEKYIYCPKQKIYETDCHKLTKIAEGLKVHVTKQEVPLRSINGSLLQDMHALSKAQLQKFGVRLKDWRVYYRKRSKALSHEMKTVLYSNLLKTNQESKQNLTWKIKETNDMLKELDELLKDMETEFKGMNSTGMEDQHLLIKTMPVIDMHQENLDVLNANVDKLKKQICKLDLQVQILDEEQDKLQAETVALEHHRTTLISLNEWKFSNKDQNRTVFTLLHETVQLEIKPEKVIEPKMEDTVHNVNIAFKFLLNGQHSQCNAKMVHKLLEDYIKSQENWMIKYPTTQHVPLLLHDVSLVVSRLRLVGEELHELKKWGCLRLGILQIICVDTFVKVTFSSLRTLTKFELSLAITADYPNRPLQMHKFHSHIGNTRVEQIKDVLSLVAPTKSYLTKVIKRIHSDILS